MKLIIINGTCGVGKSTVARALHEKMQKAFLLDIDEQRQKISHYREDEEDSRIRAYEIGKAIIQVNMNTGHDVIVDRTIVKEEFLEALLEVGREAGAEIYEVILRASKETVLQRAGDRGYRKEGLLNPENVAQIWEAMERLIVSRKDANVIDTETLSSEEVLEKVESHIFAE